MPSSEDAGFARRLFYVAVSADTAELRTLLDRYVDDVVAPNPSILGARVLSDEHGPYLSVAVRCERDPLSLEGTFHGLRVVVQRREPSSAAVGPLR